MTASAHAVAALATVRAMLALGFVALFLVIGLAVVLRRLPRRPAGVPRRPAAERRRRSARRSLLTARGGLHRLRRRRSRSLVAAAQRATTQAEAPSAASKLTAAEEHGRELFKERCATCHTLEDAGRGRQVGPEPRRPPARDGADARRDREGPRARAGPDALAARLRARGERRRRVRRDGRRPLKRPVAARRHARSLAALCGVSVTHARLQEKSPLLRCRRVRPLSHRLEGGERGTQIVGANRSVRIVALLSCASPSANPVGSRKRTTHSWRDGRRLVGRGRAPSRGHRAQPRCRRRSPPASIASRDRAGRPLRPSRRTADRRPSASASTPSSPTSRRRTPRRAPVDFEAGRRAAAHRAASTATTRSSSSDEPPRDEPPSPEPISPAALLSLDVGWQESVRQRGRRASSPS